MSNISATYRRKPQLRDSKPGKAKRIQKPIIGHVEQIRPEEIFQSTFAKSFMPLLITDRFGRCVEANETAVKLLNRKRPVLLRKTLDAIFTIHGSTTVGGFQARLSHGEPLDAEVAFEQKEGVVLRLRLRSDNLHGGLRLISLARVHKEESKGDQPIKGRTTAALLDEYLLASHGEMKIPTTTPCSSIHRMAFAFCRMTG